MNDNCNGSRKVLLIRSDHSIDVSSFSLEQSYLCLEVLYLLAEELD